MGTASKSTEIILHVSRKVKMNIGKLKGFVANTY